MNATLAVFSAVFNPFGTVPTPAWFALPRSLKWISVLLLFYDLVLTGIGIYTVLRWALKLIEEEE